MGLAGKVLSVSRDAQHRRFPERSYWVVEYLSILLLVITAPDISRNVLI